MTFLIQEYLNNINLRFKSGDATEHTYRGDLQFLLERLLPNIRVTNEPKRQKCGAPDYILTKNNIPIGFIEAKDIGDTDLEGVKKTGNKEQFERYRASLNKLIFTDYLNFHIYQNGALVEKISIAKISEGSIVSIPENYEKFVNLVTEFSSHTDQTIKSPKQLAEMMAGKARLLSDIIEKSILSDEESLENSTLKEQMLAFREVLIGNITPKEFADVYAQTIAYGMFAARLHDPTLQNFSRQEAAELIPKSNPFLRKLFGYIAGPDIDDRIKWVVENLSEVFLACNVKEILNDYGKSTKMEDPIIHFYETFLSEYDPRLRKARGVWYTPKPVVDFIVRAVDDILKTEFDLPQGIADTSKTKIKVNTQIADKRSASGYKQAEKEVHKVQILDPATGTGTFLAEVIKHIHKKFKGQQGIWSNYVEQHLIPRLNGFELLMASYAMAHLKLDLLLNETGFNSTSNQRFKVYLTNSLEESHPDTGTLFANWLSSEANEANHIKRDTPVMCVIGNPPYSGISSNKGQWISDLIEDYKYVDGVHFNERKHWLNDDYVKFIRYSQYYIEKNGSGILAFINPHGFLDNPTFRGMRWNLLKTYDQIYTIDLHGNTKRNEVSPDGSLDQNVFDIMQGVAITVFVKTGKKKENELGKVFHYDLYGRRKFKYDFLLKNSLSNISFEEINPIKPNVFFVPKDNSNSKTYNQGFNIHKLFPLNSTGIQTSRDKFVIDFDKETLLNRIESFVDINKTDDEIRQKFFSHKKAGKYKQGDTRGWKIENARKELLKIDLDKQIQELSYRPFDKRFLFYSDSVVDWTRSNVMSHLISHENLCLLMPRQLAEDEFYHILIDNNIAEMCVISNKTKEQNVVFPLYRYKDLKGQQSITENTERKPNLNQEIVNEIASTLGLTFTNEKEDVKNTFAPIDILDYIYAVLHSPTYREKYKEFLKIDFSRVPYPKDEKTFWQLVKLGGEIRQIHLLESPAVENYITRYPIDGNNEVGKLKYDDGKVLINETQYFDNVSLDAWEFYIGGYQPAQKWLKDRKGRVLDFNDILHYQKIIVALSETKRIMEEIDEIEFL